MNNKSEANSTNIKISEDVIVKIVEIAVRSIDGVHEITKSKIKFGSLFADDNTSSAIDVKNESGSVDITVNVVMSYNSKIKQTAERIQNKVKNDVQNMTGIAVTKINVIVDGIFIEENQN